MLLISLFSELQPSPFFSSFCYRIASLRLNLCLQGRKMSYLLTTLTKKQEVDSLIRSTIDKVLVLRFGRASDSVCLLLDDVLDKTAREVSKFAAIALVDIDSEDIQVYAKYFDITLIPSTVFFFNAHHMKMDSGTADHTKWVGAFQQKQDFIDVVEAIFRGAMKGKLIVSCPLPPERIPKYQLLYKDV
ncbi:PREDICTED: thioredoxin [Prunus dulcis]|uniref:Thioredoxin-like protein 4B n=1 Tax=Prunus dulcis TaxID=3755 RepID=A0A5E4G2U5_PRUDU|nr:thioredoxin-like protein 4B [Prunus dulcis]VVA34101.1 PREDICTED: thioredoxin [Prunus dulcis]